MATFTQDIFEIPEIGSLLEAESVTEERLLELAEVHELEEVLLDDLRSRLVEADVTIIKGEDDEATAIEKRALSDHAVSAELPSDLTRHFINRASRHKILTREQEVTLAKRIERGDEVAKRQLIENNMKLVIKLAGKYRDQGLEFGDLIQEGVIGLNRAAEKFDWRKGFKFSTYATWWIRQSSGRALDQKASLIRLPGDRSASLRAALRAAAGDGDELDSENAMLPRLSTPTSLDRTLGDDDSNELVDLLADATPGPEAQVMDRIDDQLLESMLGVLDNRARRAVEQRFGLGDGRRRSYREVGEELGVTAEAARRLVKRAVVTVRDEALILTGTDAA